MTRRTFDDSAFEGVGFLPWIGERYDGENRFGIRLLVLGESHYHDDGPGTTRGTIWKYTQPGGERHRFFTVIANVVRGERGWIGPEALARVFQELAFYNFVQSQVGSAPRGQPTFRQWVEAQDPLKTVLGVLRPDAVLVLGRELRRHILDWPGGIERETIAHPASSRLRYDEAFPKFKCLIERARRRH